MPLTQFGELLGKGRLSDAGGLLEGTDGRLPLGQLTKQKQTRRRGHEAQQLGHFRRPFLHVGQVVGGEAVGQERGTRKES